MAHALEDHMHDGRDAAPAEAPALQAGEHGGMPRVDIAPDITDTIIKEMRSTVWQQRKGAVEAVDGLITAAGAPCSCGYLHCNSRSPNSQ